MQNLSPWSGASAGPVSLPSALLLSFLAAACSEPSTGPAGVPVPPVAHAHVSGGFTAIDLGTLGGNMSVARVINERGQIAGWSTTSNSDRHAFLWEDGIMQDLGNLGGGGQLLDVVAINEAGEVAGYSATASGDAHAFLWKDGNMLDLGTLGGPSSVAHDMNEAGHVVGQSEIEDGGGWHRAFRWNGGEIENIGTLGSITHTIAYAVNDAGRIVGTSPVPHFIPHAFLWREEDGFLTDLGTLDGGEGESQALAINEADWVVGFSIPPSSAERKAFLWRPEDGVMMALGTLGGTWTTAWLINEMGQIAGASRTASGDGHAFLWQNGQMTDLGTLGGPTSGPLDLNDAGQVVGVSRVAIDGPAHAFLWQDGEMTDLGTLDGSDGLVHSGAQAINEAGRIVGFSGSATFHTHATLWRPLTPVEAIQQIAADVGTLEAGGHLNQGQARSLVNKLNIATAMLNDGKTGPAIRLLEAFIGEVEALIGSGQLTAEQGQPLIDAAQAAIESLG